MVYHSLNMEMPAPTDKCDRCLKISSLIMMTGTTVFSFLSFVYLEQLSMGLKNANLTEIVNIFTELRQCIIASHICG